jgi:hypothetical protein
MEGTFKSRILFLLDDKGPSSISEISRGLSENKEFVSGYLHGLADCGLLKAKRIGRAKVFLPKKQSGNRTTIQRFSVNTCKTDTVKKVNKT